MGGFFEERKYFSAIARLHKDKVCFDSYLMNPLKTYIV